MTPFLEKNLSPKDRFELLLSMGHFQSRAQARPDQNLVRPARPNMCWHSEHVSAEGWIFPLFQVPLAVGLDPSIDLFFPLLLLFFFLFLFLLLFNKGSWFNLKKKKRAKEDNLKFETSSNSKLYFLEQLHTSEHWLYQQCVLDSRPPPNLKWCIALVIGQKWLFGCTTSSSLRQGRSFRFFFSEFVLYTYLVVLKLKR